MRLQHLTVIFAIIFLPIIIITSYYIHKQVDTISLQLSYDSSLLDATYDAMSAFEINTANEDLSSVSDSLRSIIEASNNVFLTTLSTNLGYSNASKSFIQPYIPAVLYTLYDGYYIYSPSSSPVVCTDSYGQTISTDSYGVTYKGTINANGKIIGVYSFDEDRLKYPTEDSTEPDGVTSGDDPGTTFNKMEDVGIQEEFGQLLYENKDGTYSTELHSTGSNTDTLYKQSYFLKSYVAYSAEYSGTSNGKDVNVTINYSLDNFISITGKIGDVYYTKSGYLIANDLVTSINVGGTDIAWNRYSEDEITNLINSDTVVTVTLNDGTVISNQDKSDMSSTVNEDARDAVEYYAKAYMFSEWVYGNLSELQESDIDNSGLSLIIEDNSGNRTVDINYGDTLIESLIYNFNDDNDPIFSTTQNPEDLESNFATHKRNVIKNSINYNLAVAMVTYSQMSVLREYDMPVFSETDWDTILNNVSIVTFMQGFNCGLKYYNNYAIATSVNNEITVTTNEIYYVPIRQMADAVQPDGTSVPIYSDITDDYYLETAHRIDCEDLEDQQNYISFKSKEIKYDKIYDRELARYTYDHKAMLDYNCIVNSNYNFTDSSGNIIRGDGNLEETVLSLSDNKKRAYRVAVGKERNNLYKPLDYETNYGYYIYKVNTDKNSTTTVSSFNESCITRDVSEVYSVEVVLENVSNDTTNVYTDTMNLTIGGITYSVTIPTTSKSTRTVTFEINQRPTVVNNNIQIGFGGSTRATIRAIKIYYK